MTVAHLLSGLAALGASVRTPYHDPRKIRSLRLPLPQPPTGARLLRPAITGRRVELNGTRDPVTLARDISGPPAGAHAPNSSTGATAPPMTTVSSPPHSHCWKGGGQPLNLRPGACSRCSTRKVAPRDSEFLEEVRRAISCDFTLSRNGTRSGRVTLGGAFWGPPEQPLSC